VVATKQQLLHSKYTINQASMFIVCAGCYFGISIMSAWVEGLLELTLLIMAYPPAAIVTNKCLMICGAVMHCK